MLVGVASLAIFLGCLAIGAQIGPELGLPGALSGVRGTTCDAALVFLASGVGIIAALRGLRRVTAAAAIPGLSIGGATLIEYLFGIDFQIDRFLPSTPANAAALHSGRMAPAAALACVGAGLNLMVSVIGPRHARVAAMDSLDDDPFQLLRVVMILDRGGVSSRERGGQTH